MSVQDPGVYIPPAQMYQELRSLSDGLVRVETKLDGIGQGLTELGKDVADHETRIRALERARWPLPSLAAVVAVGSLGVTVWQAAGR
ncbi:hemolysin XhlA family protein [Streptomyces sp. NK08204]|uniref:hemolysin XhlA family protein n=1 Tax=Streptomyces sp. NK08204 TaxID=2873260 RepID=UPI001CEC8B53|nr:hemolysin XhlA family protein [Streptomyces sp. NK08204]